MTAGSRPSIEEKERRLHLRAVRRPRIRCPRPPIKEVCFARRARDSHKEDGKNGVVKVGEREDVDVRGASDVGLLHLRSSSRTLH